MRPATFELIDRIRAASRLMVRELGFMQSTLAATDYPPSAVHSILEIGERGSMTAADLAEFLGLEKSSVSRMVGKLVGAGELKQSAGGEDARFKSLSLTAKGRRTLAAVHRFARRQVGHAAQHLAPYELASIGEHLCRYAAALRAQRLGVRADDKSQLQIVEGYRPGSIGRVAEMHARYYSRHAGLGAFFEQRVAVGMADLTSRLGRPTNAIWTAVANGRIVGSVAIDGEDLGGREAHLRFFIVDEEARGRGVGANLLARALSFCDSREFERTKLWTFQGLDAARRLYERADFTLDWEGRGEQWGASLVEQCFVRKKPQTTLKGVARQSSGASPLKRARRV